MEDREKKIVEDVVVENKTKSKSKNTKKRKKKKLTQADIKKYPMNELDHVILKIKANEVKYTVIFVFVILIFFFVITFFTFSSVQKKARYNILRDGDLSIEFRERENGLGDIIDLVDVSTYGDSKEALDTYRVTITNNSKDAHKFQIFIQDDIDMIEIDDCEDIFLDRAFLRYSVNDGGTMVLGDEKNSVIFGTLSGNSKITYTIKVWVSDTYTGSPHYHGKIVVKEVNEEKDQ